MTDDELQAALYEQANDYKKSGLGVLSVPTVSGLSEELRTMMRRHPELLGAFIKCEYISFTRREGI